MSFIEATKAGFQNYFDFSGRSNRPEFWYFVLFTVLGSVVTSILDLALFGEEAMILSALFSLAVLIPSISITVRRLHDIGRSGWWTLLWLVPIIGWGVLIYWHCQPGVNAQAGGSPQAV